MKVPEKEILGGNIVKVVIALGWPTMVVSLLETAYNMADTFWLGRWSSSIKSISAVAAIQISWPIIFVMISIGAGFGVASISLISQYTGAKKVEKASEATGQLISIGIALALTLSIVGLLLIPYFIGIMNVEEVVGQYAVSYMRIIFLGLPFMFLSFMFMAIFRAYGDPVKAMIIEGIGVTVNIILDPILINGYLGFPSLGIIGAGIGTVTARAVSSTISLYVLFHGIGDLKLRLHHLKIRLIYARKIFRIGAPASAGQFSSAIGFYMLMLIIAKLPNSTVPLAAYGVGDRIISVGFIIINGLGMGMATVIGHSLGAKNFKRAKEGFIGTLKISFLILALMSVILALFRNQLIAFFIPSSPEVIKEGGRFLLIFGIGIPFFGIFSTVEGLYQGAGKTVPIMVMDMTRLWLFRVLLTYLLGIMLSIGAFGVWIGMSLSNVLAAMVALGFYLTGSWRHRVIDD